ncbi:MAG: twin-arginine translocase TatA/TatE family subunit [Candidatus Roizmanbacteria bacterium]
MGTAELIIITLLIALFFGGKRIPDFIRSLGKSVVEFKKALNQDDKKL